MYRFTKHNNINTYKGKQTNKFKKIYQGYVCSYLAYLHTTQTKTKLKPIHQVCASSQHLDPHPHPPKKSKSPLLAPQTG